MKDHEKQNIVVSSEIFDQLDDSGMSRMWHIVAEPLQVDIHAVLVYRDKIPHLESSYYQRAWENIDFNKNFSDFITSVIQSPVEKSFGFHIQGLMERITNHLLQGDSSKLHMISYDRVVFEGTAPFETIVEIMDGDTATAIKKGSNREKKSAGKDTFQLWPYMWKRRMNAFQGDRKQYDLMFKCFKKKTSSANVPLKCSVHEELSRLASEHYEFCQQTTISMHHFQCEDMLMTERHFCELDEHAMVDDAKWDEYIDKIADECNIPK